MFNTVNIIVYSTKSSKKPFNSVPDAFYIIIHNTAGTVILTAREYQLRNGMDRRTESIAGAYLDDRKGRPN